MAAHAGLCPSWSQTTDDRFSHDVPHFILCFLSGSKSLEDKHDDKPTNVAMTSGSMGCLRRSFQQHYLIQVATIILFIGCLYPVYNDITTMKRRFQELELKQEKSENKINYLEMEISKFKDLEIVIIELKRELSSVTKETQTNRKQLDTAKSGLNKTNTFVKEFYKNFTVTNTLTEEHNSSIQYLFNFIDALNETLVKVNDEQDERTISITQWFEKIEGCQSGDALELGSHNYPARSLPLERTIRFHPPFRKVPAVSYANTLLDSVASTSGNSLNVHLQLISLTPKSFTLKLLKAGRAHAVYGARISWMACPKSGNDGAL